MPSPRSVLVAIFLVCAAAADRADAQEPQTSRAPSPRIGVRVFGTTGLTFPAARESFETAGLDARPVAFGGGVQVTDIWRNLFVEASASRWSSTGERVFVDDDGTRYPLGIPLAVGTTHIDVSVGWLARQPRVATYVGAGAGRVLYTERSPFARSGDDLDTGAASWHLLGGVEVPVHRWVAIAGELRYRFVPGLLGAGGVSGILEEDRFGGLQTTVAVRLGFGGASRPEPAAPVAPAPVPEAAPALPLQSAWEDAVMIEAAPVFLLPDQTRTPLRTLDAGTPLNVLQQVGDWLRVEFRDPQFGPRQGYVQRKYVRLTGQQQ